MKKPPRTNRTESKAANRAALVAAAKTLFESAGYEASSLRDIAAAAGLTTGTFFANFTDKRELYREIFGHNPITAEQGKRLLEALNALLHGSSDLAETAVEVDKLHAEIML